MSIIILMLCKGFFLYTTHPQKTDVPADDAMYMSYDHFTKATVSLAMASSSLVGMTIMAVWNPVWKRSDLLPVSH